MTWPRPELAVHSGLPRRYPACVLPGRSSLATVLGKSVAGRFVRDMVQRRDAGLCRFCQVRVHGLGSNGDRRSARRGTYVLLDAGQPVTVDNVVVACATCRSVWEADPGCLMLELPPPLPVTDWWDTR